MVVLGALWKLPYAEGGDWVSAQPLEQLRADAVKAVEDLARSESVSAYRHAVDLCEQLKNHPEVAGIPRVRAEFIGFLGMVHFSWYDKRREPAVLDEGIRLMQEAIVLSPETLHPRVSLQLGAALMERHQLSGQPADLNAAVAALEPATSEHIEVPSGAAEPDQSAYLTILGKAQYQRFLLSGDLGDLTAGVLAFSMALRTADRRHPRRAEFLANLGTALAKRGQRTHGAADLRRAVSLIDEARMLTVDANLQSILSNDLATLRAALAGLTGRRSDLDATVAVMEENLDRIPPGPNRGIAMFNLARALSDRADLGSDVRDLDRAISLFTEAAEAVPPGSPTRGSRLHGLAHAYAVRAQRRSDATDWASAMECFKKGVQESAPEEQFRIAGDWLAVAAAAQAWAEAGQAAVPAREALRDLLRRQAGATHRRAYIRLSQQFPWLGALALAKCGQSAEAVEFLEQCRATLLSQMLDRDRADVELVAAEGFADLADQYRRVTAALASAETQRFAVVSAAATTELTRQRRGLRYELDQIIERIRQIPGHDRFLAPLDYSGIAAVTANTIAYLVSTPAEGLALLARPGEASPEVIWLPELSGPRVLEKIDAYWGYLSHYGRAQICPEEWSATVSAVTRWLYEAVMGEVISHLPQPRVVLVPCGLLGMLPLHAAWRPDPTMRTGRRYVLDDVLVSYAASARLLGEAHRVAASVRDDGVLVVEEPRPVRAAELPAAATEATAVLARFPAERRCHLRHEKADHDSVLRAMAQAPIWHFACHARAAPQIPQEAGILLASDRWLRVEDMLDPLWRGRSQARLAVLSACETGVSGTELADEVIGLPTVMQLAGAAGVVASLWPVRDRAAAILMGTFHRLWREDHADPSAALRAAQIWMRDADAEELHRAFPGLAPRPPTRSQAARQLLADAPPPYGDPVTWGAFTFSGV
jgi:CHAT domain-containing protein/tetratricopeptide (TPR) repeat protein